VSNIVRPPVGRGIATVLEAIEGRLGRQLDDHRERSRLSMSVGDRLTWKGKRTVHRFVRPILEAEFQRCFRGLSASIRKDANLVDRRAVGINVV